MSCRVFAAVLLLAACSDAPPPEPERAFPEMTARFVLRRDDQVIEVASLGPRGISAAVLHVPGQADMPAASIESMADPTRRFSTTAMLSSDGVTSGPDGAAANGEESLPGQIASLALIRVTQPADYAAGWQQARIEVILGRGSDRITETLAAPTPP
jgi:hypothetical protein